MMPIRYIRDWLHGNTVSANDNWLEINALTGAGVNAAAGKSVAASSVGNNLPSLLTDGDITCVSGTTYSQFFITGPVPPQFVVVDLGTVRSDITTVTVWHWYSDGRTYHDTKTEASADGVNWFTLFDSSLHGEYAETPTGHIIPTTSGFAMVCGDDYFQPYRPPEPAQAVPTHYHATTVTAGGVTYCFPDSLAETLITYTWPCMSEAERSALDAFFLLHAVGTVNQLRIIDPYLLEMNGGTAFYGEFASPEYSCSEVSAGIFEVSFQIRLTIV